MMKLEHMEEECKSEIEDYGKFTDTVEGIRVTKQMVFNKKTGVIKPKYDQHYVSLNDYDVCEKVG